MEKILFKDYPDTTTPIDANNLNTMQDNAEASIIEVDTKNTNLKNQVANGWYEIGPTAVLTFSSWDASVYTGVVSTNIDLTSALSLGMKIKLTQNGVVKYGFITAITSSAITLFMGTDYILEDIAISDMCYSMLKAPYGFPYFEEKWAIKVKDTAQRTQISPGANSWYNVGNLKIDLPIGIWKVKYKAALMASRAGSGTIDPTKITLSSSNNTESDDELTSTIYFSKGDSSDTNMWLHAETEKTISAEEKTTRYLNIMTTGSGFATIELRGDFERTLIKAVCAYL